MAVKKSELYSSLWQSCDELRGGMDPSQYKDYVLVMLFIKYVSDRYAALPFPEVIVPPGASFRDMAALKGKPDIGDRINKQIVAPLMEANRLSDFPDFNSATKLGSGKEMVDRLTNLIAIFENPALDFSGNRAEGDDLLGDAYEYLMRHFATESGKSKGQFYTPAEVSRVMAQILGIRDARTSPATTVYDPTCGSGSLLLKVADEARTSVTIYGQEKDASTAALAHMNMILHENPAALIEQGNTLADPKYRDGDTLKTFDYVVANPPFSDKRWSNGIEPLLDPFQRFSFGAPPARQGDYAYLLHIVRSLRPGTGKGACILPHGVLFRGNAEGEIRKNLVRSGYIKGIIGLPANLFYGTGIPACIVALNKENAGARKGIFFIDASRGFMKDGPKNRLRAMDIHRIVDTFNRRLEVPGYSRMVPLEEIERNDFNLNIPRYIDAQEAEDVQDIDAHLRGGIPERDVDALERFWSVCPHLRATLFRPNRPGYLDLAVDRASIRAAIHDDAEFAAFVARMDAHFDAWRRKTAQTLKALEVGFHPRALSSLQPLCRSASRVPVCRRCAGLLHCSRAPLHLTLSLERLTRTPFGGTLYMANLSVQVCAYVPFVRPIEADLLEWYERLLEELPRLELTASIGERADAKLVIDVALDEPPWPELRAAWWQASYRAREIDFIRVQTETDVDPTPLQTHGISATGALEGAKDGAALDLTKVLGDVVLAVNLAWPGVMTTVEAPVFVDGVRRYSGMKEYQAWLLYASVSYAREVGWPQVDALSPLQTVIDWLRSIPGYDRGLMPGSLGRALAALSYLLLQPGELDLVWAVMGLEAIYARGVAGLKEQLVAKTRVFLGPPPTHKKLFGQMYDYRSRLVHGDLDLPLANCPYDATDEFMKYSHESYEAALMAIAVLLATLQKMISTGRSGLEFGYVLLE